MATNQWKRIQRVYIRMIEILLYDDKKYNKTIYGKEGDNLYRVMCHNHIIPSPNCNGKGICGSCKVYIDDSKSPILACKYVLEKNVRVNIGFLLREPDSITESIEITNAIGTIGTVAFPFYIVSIDIGTTTIGMELYDNAGKVLTTHGFPNPQIAYGSDIPARIAYSSNGNGLKELNICIITKLYQGLCHMIKPYRDILENKNIYISVTGNTTMLHIFQGFSVSSIGIYPFKPYDIARHVYDFADIFTIDDLEKSIFAKTKVLVNGSLSGYIGSDILAGATYLNLNGSDKYNMLIDLGTNGEMMLTNKHHGLCTSTACGPAFDKALVSSYGSNIIDILARCIRNRLINKQGLIVKRFIEKGIPVEHNVFITEEIVRSIQLAKAAIYTGITSLIRELGIGYEDIDKVYIAGGFGFYLNIENAIYIGMLPKELKDKYIVAGNTSLLGARQAGIEYVENTFAKDCNIYKEEDLIGILDTFNLSELEDFNNMYIASLDFI